MGTRACLKIYILGILFYDCHIIHVYNPVCLRRKRAMKQLHRKKVKLEGDTSEVLNSRGIPGWDKVEQLARALLSFKGLSISKEQATIVSSLCDQLDSTRSHWSSPSNTPTRVRDGLPRQEDM